MATKTEERVSKLQDKLARAKRDLQRQNALAAARASGKAKQCAMISFNLLRKVRPEVLAWVETQLTRDQDIRAFAEWRATDQAPAAKPAADPIAELEQTLAPIRLK